MFVNNCEEKECVIFKIIEEKLMAIRVDRSFFEVVQRLCLQRLIRCIIDVRRLLIYKERESGKVFHSARS